MNCRNCGARMRFIWDRDHFICDYCKTYDFPEEGQDSFKIIDERSGLHCPVCSSELQVASLLKMRVLHCGNCRGFLMKQDRFRLLVSNIRAGAADPPVIPDPVDKKDLLRQVRCPHCRHVMENACLWRPRQRHRGQLPTLHGHMDGLRRAEKNQGRSRSGPPDGTVRSMNLTVPCATDSSLTPHPE